MPFPDCHRTSDRDLSDAVLALTDWHVAMDSAHWPALPRPAASPVLALCAPDAMLVDAAGARRLCAPVAASVDLPGATSRPEPQRCSADQGVPAVESVTRFGADLIALRICRGCCNACPQDNACSPGVVTYLMQRQGADWRICLIADSL